MRYLNMARSHDCPVVAEVKESSALIQSKAYLIGHDLWHPEPFPIHAVPDSPISRHKKSARILHEKKRADSYSVIFLLQERQPLPEPSYSGPLQFRPRSAQR